MFYIYFPLIILFSLQGPLKFKKIKGKQLPENVAIINFFNSIGSKLNVFDKFVWPKIKESIEQKFKNKKIQKKTTHAVAIFCIVFISLIIALFGWLLFEEMFM